MDLATARARFASLKKLGQRGQDTCTELLALAAWLRTDGSDVDLACLVSGSAVQHLTTSGRYHQAQSVLAEATRYALGAPGPGPAHAASYRALHARLLLAMGDHAAAAQELVTLIESPAFLKIRPLNRLNIIAFLVSVCDLVDPGDSLTCCIGLAEWAWRGQKEPMPSVFVWYFAHIRIQQFLWSAECFAGMLRRPAFDERTRSQLLSEASVQLQSVVEGRGMPQADAFDETIARAHLWICRALLQSDADLALRALEAESVLLGDAAREPAALRQQAALRQMVGETLLVLGAATRAHAVLEALLEPADKLLQWDERLSWLYLRSAVAGARGDHQRAYEAYRQYVKEAGEHFARINFDLPRLLRRLTSLKGAKPQDLPRVRPAYLDRALETLRADGSGLRVASLADAVGVSDRTLRDAFKLHLGKGPKQVSVDLRLDAARERLQRADGEVLNIADLAAEFGFSHPSRFARLYRDRFGVGPTARLSGRPAS